MNKYDYVIIDYVKILLLIFNYNNIFIIIIFIIQSFLLCNYFIYIKFLAYLFIMIYSILNSFK